VVPPMSVEGVVVGPPISEMLRIEKTRSAANNGVKIFFHDTSF